MDFKCRNTEIISKDRETRRQLERRNGRKAEKMEGRKDRASLVFNRELEFGRNLWRDLCVGKKLPFFFKVLEIKSTIKLPLQSSKKKFFFLISTQSLTKFLNHSKN